MKHYVVSEEDLNELEHYSAATARYQYYEPELVAARLQCRAVEIPEHLMMMQPWEYKWIWIRQIAKWFRSTKNAASAKNSSAVSTDEPTKQPGTER